MRECAHQVLEDLREVIGVLRVDASVVPERPQPDLSGLERLVGEARGAGTTVSVDSVVAAPSAAPAAIGRAAYRIVQEGLTNSRKHAPGQPVSVTVRGAPGRGLSVTLHNPLAAGPAGVPGSGTGLIGLAERAGIAGGTWPRSRPTCRAC
ncbi:hypothetical protein ABT369_17990 [Dactylosporangium sp. NPDC000244]|uniref:sensor histidine kinase n=1 Tax=Dactylosporangium sp. NPDC000244 TaxID=3154365 RepID=UPI00331FFD33